MKYIYSCLILSIFFSFSLSAQEKTPDWRGMHYLSAEEMNEPLNVSNFYETDPPLSPARNVAEFDQMQAIIVRYPFGVPISLIKEIAKDMEVLTLVVDASEQQAVILDYTNNNVNLENCSFLQVPTESYWIRDYGPWFVFDGNNQPGIVNFPYNRPRPNDNDIPIQIANYLNIDLYGMNLIHTGGNYMTDGLGKSSSTELVLEENPGLDWEDVDSLVYNYLNIENYYVIDDPLDEYIKHIDCWGKFLSPGKVLIGEVPASDDRYDDFEAVADFFANTVSSWGKPYEVFRVYTPGTSPNTPYTNSLIANKKVFVPLTGSQWDNAAISSYQEAMPGYEIVGITYGGWLNTDALHCRTKGIADIEMLYIKHVPILGTVGASDNFEITAELIACSGEDIYTDSALIYYSIKGGTYQTSTMEWEAGDTWTGSITGAGPGDDVSYYIYAADESGRQAQHPFIGEPDPHEFSVFGMQTDEIYFNPDTVTFLTDVEVNEGVLLNIVNIKNDSIEITYISPNQGDYAEFYWYVEEIPELPVKIGSHDTLTVLVRIDIPIIKSREILFDSLFVTTPKDTYHAIITLDSDLVGIEEHGPEMVLTVFPNPFSDKLSFSFSLSESQQVKLTIYDLSGKVVFNQERDLGSGNQSLIWKTSADLKAGYYFYRLQTGDKTESGKIILNR